MVETVFGLMTHVFVHVFLGQCLKQNSCRTYHVMATIFDPLRYVIFLYVYLS